MMDRRQLFRGLGAACGMLSFIGKRAAGAELKAKLAPPEAPPRIWIDGCGEAFDTAGKLPLEPGVLASAVASGLSAVNFTVVGPGADFEQTVRSIAFVEAVVEKHGDRLLIVRDADDILLAKKEGKLGLMLGFQTTDMLGEDLSRIEVFRRLGVRIMQLTYNDRNLFGDGCLEPGNAGLSRLGRRAVEKMNVLGVAIDVSHSGDRTTRDAIEASRGPILISHTGCRAVFSHQRNKEDSELKALADRGGVAGIYLMPFLSSGPGPVTPDDFYRHVEHALNVCGEDHVGVGSDQGVDPIADTPEYRRQLRAEIEARRKAGVSAPGESADRPPFIPELNAADRFSRIADGLSRRGHSGSVVDKIAGGNFFRALKEIWNV